MKAPRDPFLLIACEAVLPPQLGCMSGGKFLASDDSQISNLPLAHSQPPLPYYGCFPRKVVFVAVKDVL